MPLPEVYPERAKNTPRLQIRWLDVLVLMPIMGVGLALRFAHLTSKPFWFDECFSVELARLRWGSFLRVLWWREANMSLYYALLRAGLHFGQSEFFIRSFSILFAVATIPAIYWLARQLYDRKIALLAAALFTVNAYNVRYSQEARSYTLFVLLATLSCGLFVSWLRKPSRGKHIGYILTSVLAVYAHFYALLLIAVQWMVLRLFLAPNPENAREAVAPRHIPWKVIGIGIFPLLVFIATTGAGPIRWMHRPGLHDLLTFWRDISGGSNWLLPAIFALACIAGAAMAGKRLIRRDQTWETWRIQFLLVWLLFPIVLTVGLSFLRPVFLPRFLIFCQPALLILAAAGIAQLRRIWLIAPALVLIFCLALAGTFFVYGHDYDDQRDGSGEAVNFILDHSQPGDGIVFYIAEARAPYEFFRSLRVGENTAGLEFTGKLGPDILFPHNGSGLDYSDFKAKPIPEILRSQFSDHSRVWVMFMYNQAGGAGRTTAMLTQLLSQFFAHTECREFPKVEVCLYSMDAGPGIRGQSSGFRPGP
jgi:mannosyltransferase